MDQLKLAPLSASKANMSPLATCSPSSETLPTVKPVLGTSFVPVTVTLTVSALSSAPKRSRTSMLNTSTTCSPCASDCTWKAKLSRL